MDALLAELQQVIGDRATSKSAVREHHAKDESWHAPVLPDIVCFAETTEEVSRLLKICNTHRTPVVPFGAGSGVEGAAIASAGGVCIDLSRMNRILEVNREDLDCTVEAGVTRQQLNAYLHDTGLYFPVDPGAEATLGGMAATRASGTSTVRYGTMRDNVLSLTAVLPDGRIMRTGQRARKSAAGYDLTRLMIGSEGTLGIITELVLRLHGRPEAISAARVCFETVDAAVDTAIRTIQFGIPVARIEFIDGPQIESINRYSKTDYPACPTLFLEFHGSAAAVEEQARTVGEICADLGGSDFEWSAQEEDRRQLWQARHTAAYAAMAERPGGTAYATDVCVPISRLAECIRETRTDLDANCSLKSYILGHVGDGNFHCALLVDPNDPGEVKQVKDFSARLVERAQAMGGTCTGEHGIGIGKRDYLEAEFGSAGIAMMRSIKQAVDPHGIMNPGTLLPEA
jgi:D-lactate dehydrogenase (cytochrome)